MRGMAAYVVFAGRAGRHDAAVRALPGHIQAWHFAL